MKMYTRRFNSARELTEFVNETGIQKDQIISSTPDGDGTFLLMYYAE